MRIYLQVILNSILVFCLEISKIPSTGTPPEKSLGVSVAYYESKNQIIIFGGFIQESNEYLSRLHTFDLTELSWDELYPESDYIPPGLSKSNSMIYSDILYVFYGEKSGGLSANVFSFNLETYIWRVEYLQGDNIKGRHKFGFTTFEHSDSTYVAIFGGLTHSGSDNDLFL